MGIKSIALVASTLVLSTGVNAALVTLDFDDSSLAGQFFLDGELALNTPVKIGTFGANGAIDILNPSSSYTAGPTNGTGYLHSSIFSTVFIEANAEEYFSLNSLDLGEYSSSSTNVSVTLTGYKENGTQVSTTLFMDGLFDGLGGINDFQVITFDSTWSNLTRVEFDNSAYSLDNIQLDVSAVPVPAAAWLFGSGLIGLVGMARRKS